MSSRHYNRVLVFDVETNGLFPYQKAVEAPPPLETLPYILQLSFVVYDPKSQKIVTTANHYVRVADDIPISEEITTLTGIDRRTVNEKGVSITHALKEFYEAYMNCDCVVAHNIEFDRRMILTEVARNCAHLEETMGLISAKKMFDPDFQLRNRVDNFCTMRYSRGICKIERVNKKGETYYKNPRLVELYEFLFHSIPKNLHDSMVDTYACLQCFVKMKLRQDLVNPFLAVAVSGASAV